MSDINYPYICIYHRRCTVSVLASSVVNSRFESLPGQMKDSSVVNSRFESLPGQMKEYYIGICCFSAMNTS